MNEVRPLIPKVIDRKIVVTNKSEYDMVRISVDEMEYSLNNCYQRGRTDERNKVIDELKKKVSHSAYNRKIQMISMELLWEILEQLKENTMNKKEEQYNQAYVHYWVCELAHAENDNYIEYCCDRIEEVTNYLFERLQHTESERFNGYV